jgi:hypothetical protein
VLRYQLASEASIKILLDPDLRHQKPSPVFLNFNLDLWPTISQTHRGSVRNNNYFDYSCMLIRYMNPKSMQGTKDSRLELPCHAVLCSLGT